jgi:hypothetical protein
MKSCIIALVLASAVCTDAFVAMTASGPTTRATFLVKTSALGFFGACSLLQSEPSYGTLLRIIASPIVTNIATAVQSSGNVCKIYESGHGNHHTSDAA